MLYVIPMRLFFITFLEQIHYYFGIDGKEYTPKCRLQTFSFPEEDTNLYPHHQYV